MQYKYEISGTAVRGQTWVTTGEVEIRDGMFYDMLMHIGSKSFTQLTDGKAVFGQPGVGCQGPYRITKFVVEAV